MLRLSTVAVTAVPRAIPDTSVSVLVKQAAAGERSAEAVLCRRFVPAIRAYARRRLRGDAADEFTQDVLLLLVQAVRSSAVAEPERVGGFVLGICRNLARDRARMAERRAALWEAYGPTIVGLEEQAPETVGHELAHLEDCLSQLSERSRTVVRASYVEERSNAEIAADLAVAEGNVRVLRHRALRALRDCMSQFLSWELS